MDNIQILHNQHIDIVEDANACAQRAQTYTIGQNCQLNLTLLLQPTEKTHDINLSFLLEKNSSLRVELIAAYSCANITIRCALNGQQSNAVINGAYLTNKTEKITINTTQHHTAPHTQSNVIMRGIADNCSSIDYRGMVRIEKEAQQSISCQENKNIILSPNARIVSVPSLEVLANDVRCAHASAISKPDQELLFYAASRAIKPKNMEKLLIKSFFATLFNQERTKAFIEEQL